MSGGYGLFCIHEMRGMLYYGQAYQLFIQYMQTFLIVLVAAILLGGGWYWYTQQSAAPATTNVEGASPFGTDTNTQNAPTGQMEDGTIPESNTGTNAGTSVNVGASANVSTGTVKEFTVSGQNFSFSPSRMTVKKGDTVKITFKNVSGTHDFRIDGYNVGTRVIQSGAQEMITFVADKAGSFEYFCSVGEHRAMGMKGTLTVTN